MAAAGDTNQTVANFMKDPKIMAALQSRLADLEGMRSPFFESLPKSMKNRVYAIRNIQKEYIQMESEFYNEVNLLEQKYHQKYQSLYARRLQILNGEYEPTEVECIHSDAEDEDEENNDKENTETKSDTMEENDKSAEDTEDAPFPEDVKGVPEFWSTVLRSAGTTMELIDECDEPILKSLTNITLTYLTPEQAQTADIKTGTIGFTLNFHFDDNEYFSDSVLTKTYKLRLTPDDDDVLNYEGPEIIECVGCKINWKSDEMNVTKTIIKKKQKNKKTGAVRVTTTTEAKESFFNYFSSIEEKLNLVRQETDLDDDPEEQESFMREADYEIGHFIRERLIPRAVLYYTGELNDDEDDEEDDEDYEEDMDEDDEEGEEDPDFDPSQAKDQPECKQQ